MYASPTDICEKAIRRGRIYAARFFTCPPHASRLGKRGRRGGMEWPIRRGGMEINQNEDGGLPLRLAPISPNMGRGF